MYELLTILSFSLAWFSLGVTIIIAHGQVKLREELKLEKVRREQHASIILDMTLHQLQIDFERVGRHKPTPLSESEQKLINESLKKFQESQLLYYSDLRLEFISNANLIINHMEIWINYPCYVETTPNVTMRTNRPTKYPYEIILQEIKDFVKLLRGKSNRYNES